ncbi:MAG: phytanoyl-CoA dioxygenase [Herminiimonas sp.]|nr:phytanoyl-CoA dioxygenase [Herminiimonas sp.]
MPLSTQQIEQFNQDGYLILRHMAPTEQCERMLAVTAEHLRKAIAPLEYEAEVGYEGAPQSLDAAGGLTVRRLRRAYERDDCFRDWARDTELVTMLTQLFGEPVCLSLAHHNCVMTKHPDFGSATGWHRDIRYWSFTRPDLISVWLGLGDETADNGGLKFLPGSHRMHISRDRMDDLDFLRPEVAENQRLFEQAVSPELHQGDVVLFHSGLFHAAGRNNSARVKASVVFAYHGASNPPVAGSKSAAGGSLLPGERIPDNPK